jgi:lysophospholipase L1-like esterase
MRRTARSTAVAALLVLVLVAGACADHGKEDPTRSTATTTTLVPRPAGFVALGDSFTSGGGAPPYDVSAICAVSTKGWPYVLDSLDDQVQLVENRACGGATIDRLLGPWESRGQPAQLPATPNPDIGLVVFSIGGNDTNVVTAIAACATLDCSRLPDSAKAEENSTALTRRLVKDVYPALRKAYPKARLVHLAYPRVTSNDPAAICPWLSSDEQTVPDALIDGVDEAIASATRQSGDVEYLDLRTVLEGHELCTEEPWENDLDQGANSLHPNAQGYVAIGKAIDEALTK